MPEAAPASRFARHATDIPSLTQNINRTAVSRQADDDMAQKPRTPLTPVHQNQSRSPKLSPPVRPFLLACVLSV